MFQDGSNAKLPEARTNLGIRSFSPVKDHGADPTGATDATTAIQASQADCVAAGGGVIDIVGARLLVGSASITVAANCPIQGVWAANAPATATISQYATATSTLVHGSAQTINVGAGARLEGVLVLASNLPATVTTFQQGAAMVAGMATAGTGVTITGHGAIIRDVGIYGFNLGLSSAGWAQLHLDNVQADGTACFRITFSHDVSHGIHLECWPHLTASQSWTTTNSAISNVADNGSGKIRVTSPARPISPPGIRCLLRASWGSPGRTRGASTRR